MIVRILGEGHFDVVGEHLDEVNFLDSQLQSAAAADDRDAFASALQALGDAVRRTGGPGLAGGSVAQTREQLTAALAVIAELPAAGVPLPVGCRGSCRSP
jgi:hypothetical protein